MTILAFSAFIAGILMFLAPCTLPLVPAYLAFIAGVPALSLGKVDRGVRRKIFFNALWFVVGFSLIFILFGTLASSLGALLGEWRGVLSRLGGLLLILFGFVMLGPRIPFLSREWHARLPHSLTLGHPHSSFLIGALFAIGWSPCIGPVLGSVLLLASTESTALQGALLLSIFSAGLAVPFLLSAALIGEASRWFVRFSRAAVYVYGVAGVILIGIGLLLLTNKLNLLFSIISPILDGIGYSRLINLL